MRMMTEFPSPQHLHLHIFNFSLTLSSGDRQLFSPVLWVLPWLVKRNGNSHQCFSRTIENSDLLEEDDATSAPLVQTCTPVHMAGSALLTLPSPGWMQKEMYFPHK